MSPVPAPRGFADPSLHLGCWDRAKRLEQQGDLPRDQGGGEAGPRKVRFERDQVPPEKPGAGPASSGQTSSMRIIPLSPVGTLVAEATLSRSRPSAYQCTKPSTRSTSDDPRSRGALISNSTSTPPVNQNSNTKDLGERSEVRNFISLVAPLGRCPALDRPCRLAFPAAMVTARPGLDQISMSRKRSAGLLPSRGPKSSPSPMLTTHGFRASSAHRKM